MRNDPQDTMTKDEVFAALEARGVVRATVEFAGGHDSGAVENVVLITSDGTELPTLDYKERNQYDFKLGKYVDVERTPEEVEDSRLWRGLTDKVYEKYGSFAGEFYVNGEILWDVTKRTATMAGSEEVADYVSFADEV